MSTLSHGRAPESIATGRGPSRIGDRLFHAACLAAAVAVLGIAAMLVIFLVARSWLALQRFGLWFLAETDWDPSKQYFGAGAFVWGTLATSFLAMLIAVPLGVGSATFLAEIAPAWLRRVGSFLIELLAAIPSVVYGFWGIFFLAPGVQWIFNRLGGPNTGGLGIVSAGLILSIMVLPYIAAISFDVIRAVPQAQRQGALALGATRWQMIWSVVLPYARPGIFGACFLALGRALGETMAVTMLIGNRPDIKLSLFAVGDSIASKIAKDLKDTSDALTISSLIELGLVLFLVTVVVNGLARLLIWQVAHGRKAAWPGWLPQFHKTFSPVPADGPPPAFQEPSGHRSFAQGVNRFMTAVMGACLALTLGPLFLILGYITLRGATSLSWGFFFNPPPGRSFDAWGLGHAIYGSGLLVGLATLFAVPIGLLAALYLVEYRTSRLAGPLRLVGELLGGVPSIVIGIFGYALLVAPLRDFSAVAGGFALGVMMIPIIMRSSEESLKLVPQSIRNASYALGANHWQTVFKVVVPAALPSIITGVLLAVGRIAGETAPLLMTALNSQHWPDGLMERTPYLTYYIYNGSRSEFPYDRQQAWAAAFVLLTLVMLLNVGIRLATGRRVMQASRAE